MKQTLKDILQDLRILYIEDEADTRKFVSEILTMLCRRVIAVETANEGLVQYKQEMPDIILSDVDLPGMNGIELVKEIRKENKTIPIILLTAHTKKEYLMDAVKLHLVDYITKPLDIKKLTLALYDSAQEILNSGEFMVKFITGSMYNISKNIVIFQNQEYILTYQEELLLQILLKNRHRSVNTDEILEYVWEYGEGTSSALRSLLNKLRKKIGKESIVNISAIGYRIILD
jgi:DNA-binding response OmpR family regulator